MRKLLLGLLLFVIGAVIGVGVDRAMSKADQPAAAALQMHRDAIDARIQSQAASWNAGDVDGFMQPYWQSRELRFASGGDITKGWQPTTDRYKARYPDKATMGQLAFSDIDINVLSDQDALAFGRWTLTRDGDTPTGLFTLHFQRKDGAWVIVSDHTSSSD